MVSKSSLNNTSKAAAKRKASQNNDLKRTQQLYAPDAITDQNKNDNAKRDKKFIASAMIEKQ